MLVALIAWTTFAFAGVYPSALLLPLLLAAGLAIVFPDWTRCWSAAERWIALGTGLCLLQLLPLPRLLIDTVSPHRRAVAQQFSLSAGAWLPISINPLDGWWACAAGLIAVLLFLTAAQLFHSGGVRILLRGVAMIGLALSGIALAQDATAHGRIYWHWKPLQEGAPPFGPFVDRNHFATWILLALPMTAGYLAAHVSYSQSRSSAPHLWRRRLVQLLDGRSIWLSAAIALMALALLATLSRSGLFGLMVAVGCGALARMRRQSGITLTSALWIAGAVVLALALGLSRIDPAALAHRLGSAGASASERVSIWRDTVPVVDDFWLTGTGAGTYETAMLVYQRTVAGARVNQAHNQYLQLVAEGGLLLTVPVLIGLAAYLRRARTALIADRSGMFWVRAGAAASLAAVAAQGIFETGLATPANAVLAAICGAVLIHVPGGPSSAAAPGRQAAR